MQAADPGLDHKLRTAIARRRLVTCIYDGRFRKAEPHDYGVIKGAIKLSCFQIGGGSSTGEVPGWRTFFVARISEFKVTDETFAGARKVSGRHLQWDLLFASVSWKERTQQQQSRRSRGPSKKPGR